jgi:cation transport regulator ChaB
MPYNAKSDLPADAQYLNKAAISRACDGYKDKAIAAKLLAA